MEALCEYEQRTEKETNAMQVHLFLACRSITHQVRCHRLKPTTADDTRDSHTSSIAKAGQKNATQQRSSVGCVQVRWAHLLAMYQACRDSCTDEPAHRDDTIVAWVGFKLTRAGAQGTSRGRVEGALRQAPGP